MKLDLRSVDLNDTGPHKNNGKARKAPDVAQARVPPTIVDPGRQLGPEFFSAYAEYVENSESPADFHFWTALSCVSAVAQRKLLMEAAHFVTLSNLYVVLVGPAGARKTTAINIGRELLLDIPTVNFASAVITPAALIQELGEIPNTEHQSLTVFSDEFGSFLSVNPQEMTELATDLFDGRRGWKKRTIARATEKLTAPWLNILAGTTTTWLGTHLPASALESGFVPRCLFVFSDEIQAKHPFPQRTEQQEKLREKLIADLTHIATLAGNVTFSTDGLARFTDWYMDVSRLVPVRDPRVGPFYTRKPTHVQKVAMLLSLVESDDLLIHARHVDAALALVSALEPGMKKALTSVGRNEFATDLERIAEQIKDAPQRRLRKRDLVRANISMLTKQQLDAIVEQLRDMEFVRMPDIETLEYTGP
jgi:hypothetical protein